MLKLHSSDHAITFNFMYFSYSTAMKLLRPVMIFLSFSWARKADTCVIASAKLPNLYILIFLHNEVVLSNFFYVLVSCARSENTCVSVILRIYEISTEQVSCIQWFLSFFLFCFHVREADIHYRISRIFYISTKRGCCIQWFQ